MSLFPTWRISLVKEGEKLDDMKTDLNKAAVAQAVQEESRKAHEAWA